MRQKFLATLSYVENKTEHIPEEKMTYQVMDMFHINEIYVLRVYNYHQMSEHDKRKLCDTFMDVTICKIPERNTDALCFYLNKRYGYEYESY